MSASRTLTFFAAAIGIMGAQAQSGQSTTFEEPFNPYDGNFCSNGSVVAPTPALMLFPFTAKQMYAVVGNFSDPSWQGLIVSGFHGEPNTPGAELDLANEPLDHREILDRYALDNTTYAHQQVTHTIPPVTFPNVGPFVGAGPNYTIQASHNVLSLIPACDGQAAYLNLSVSYCMAGQPVDPNFSLADLVSGTRATPALQELWNRVANGTASSPSAAQQKFNANLTCANVDDDSAPRAPLNTSV